MALYKASDNSIHDDMGGAALPLFQEHLGPYVEISEQEAEQLRAQNNPVDFRTPLLESIRSAREIMLNRFAGIGLVALADGDTATVEAIKVARTGLLNLTTAPGVAEATTEQELKTAVYAAYLKVVQAAPANLKNAFYAFDL